MLYWFLLSAAVTTMAPPPPPAPNAPQSEVPSDLARYAAAVRQRLLTALPAWSRDKAKRLRSATRGDPTPVSLLEIEIGPRGAAQQIRLVLPNRNDRLDDLGRELLLAADPFAPPAEALLGGRPSLPCLVRLTALDKPQGKGGHSRIAVACRQPSSALGSVAGLPATDGPTPTDPGAQLMAGWLHEAGGQRDEALAAYRQAVAGAPTWAVAAHALGRSLVEAKRLPEAIPFLKIYVAAHDQPADAMRYRREVQQHERQLAKRLAEANKPRQRLSKRDIALGVRKGYPLLEPCLERARSKRALRLGVETLTFTWTVRKDGSVVGATLKGPSDLLMTGHAECLESAVQRWRFPPYTEGSEITVRNVPLKVAGSRPEQVATTAGETARGSAGAAVSASAAETMQQPTFSVCQRSGDEIGSYIRGRQPGIASCVQAELSRAPNAPYPTDLPIAFVVDVDGSIRGVSIEHRFFREGPLLACVQRALAGAMAPSDGADCPAEFSLALQKLALGR